MIRQPKAELLVCPPCPLRHLQSASSLAAKDIARPVNRVAGRAGPAASVAVAGTKDLLAWADGQSLRHDAIAPQDFPDSRGMAACKDLLVEDELTAVPLDLALVVPPRQPCPFPEFVNKTFWSESPWYMKLALMLLHEKELGETSRLAPYLAYLPQSFNTPFSWSDQELQQLAYPFMAQEVKAQRQDWQDLWSGFKRQHPGTKLTHAQLMWALHCVRSRAFSGPFPGASWKNRLKLLVPVIIVGTGFQLASHAQPDQLLNGVLAAALFNVIYDALLARGLRAYTLCPFIDFMNHSSAAGGGVTYAYFRSAIVATAGKAFKKGEQVFISYGKQSNDSLLQFYGFVEEDNPHDGFVICNAISKLRRQGVPGADFTSPRLEWLQAQRKRRSAEQITVTSRGLSSPSAAALRVLVATDGEYANRQSDGFAAFEQPLQPATEVAVRQIVLGLAEKELALFEEARARGSAALPGTSGQSDAAPLIEQFQGCLLSSAVDVWFSPC